MDIEAILGIDKKMKRVMLTCALVAAYFAAIITPSIFTSDALYNSFNSVTNFVTETVSAVPAPAVYVAAAVSNPALTAFSDIDAALDRLDSQAAMLEQLFAE